MKQIQARAKWESNKTNAVALKDSSKAMVNTVRDSIILKYDKTKGPVKITVIQENPSLGCDFAYRVNGGAEKPIRVNGFSFTYYSPDDPYGYADLATEPNTGEIEIFLGLGLSKRIEIDGAGLTEIVTFSKFDLPSSYSYRLGGDNLVKVPPSIPSHLKTLEWMFGSCKSINDPNISLWNTINIESMDNMFYECTAFNQPLPWNVSKVRYMTQMFWNASSFNQNLRNWCVALLTSEPTQFSQGSPLSAGNKPVWGTCPNNTFLLRDATVFTQGGAAGAIIDDGTVTLEGQQVIFSDFKVIGHRYFDGGIGVYVSIAEITKVLPAFFNKYTNLTITMIVDGDSRSLVLPKKTPTSEYPGNWGFQAQGPHGHHPMIIEWSQFAIAKVGKRAKVYLMFS